MPQREDPALLPALPVLTETITVEDPRAPGKTFDFLFSLMTEQTESDAWFVMDKAQRFEEEYINSDKRIDVNGQFIPIEKNLCLHIAMFIEAETLATGESWTFPQWVIFSHKAPTAFSRLIAGYTDLFHRARPAKTEDEEEAATEIDEESSPKNA